MKLFLYTEINDLIKQYKRNGVSLFRTPKLLTNFVRPQSRIVNKHEVYQIRNIQKYMNEPVFHKGDSHTPLLKRNGNISVGLKILHVGFLSYPAGGITNFFHKHVVPTKISINQTFCYQIKKENCFG